MKLRSTMIAGLAVFSLLGGIVPAYCAEEGEPAAAAQGIGELLRVLEEKKVITPDEARDLGKKFSHAGTAGETKEAETAAGAAGLPAAPFAPEEAAEALDILVEEGIISEEEKGELTLRLDELSLKARGEQVAERQRQTVGTDDIEYRMTAIPVEEVRDRLRFLAFQKVMTRAEAAQAFERYGRKHPADQLAESVTAEVGKDVRRRIGQKMAMVSEIQGKTDKLPEWLNRFKLSGDIRLRYQGEFFDENNNPVYQSPYNLSLINTLANRHRLRTRARLGVTAKVNDQVEAGIRLATGNEKEPVSTNDTLGDYFNKDGFVLDLAYLQWKPLTGLTLWGGRLPNPWFSTDLVWDQDLNFEGFAASYAPRISDALDGFLTAGIFPLEELEFSQRDKWLLGAQIGGEYRPHENVGMKLGVAYYRFENIQGRPFETPDLDNFSGVGINVTNTQKGNTVFNLNSAGTAHFPGLGSKFEELNVTAALDLGFWDPVHLVFMGDYVRNLGFNRDEVFTLTGDKSVGNDNEGYQVGVSVGHAQVKEPWQWKTYLFYKRLEADAVVDLFTDSDFHLGGTNAKGWIIGGDLGLMKNFWLSAKWLTANQINDRTPGPDEAVPLDAGPFDVDVFQFNLNAKF